MEILTGGRQSGQNLYNALKLYNYIDSLQNDTTVRVVKKDGICVLCVNESISIQKVKDNIEKLKAQYKTALEKNSTEAFILKCQITILQELIKESEE